MEWDLLISPPSSPWMNMAMDEYLLKWVATSKVPCMRFYAWEGSAVSFGYFQSYEEIASLTHVRPLVRRPTGGGLVSHVSDWTYCLAVPTSHDWYALKACDSYQSIHQWVCEALNRLNIKAELAGEAIATGPGQCFLGAEKHDVLLGRFKIAGAAQRRTRDGLLIQGSVQINDLCSMASRQDWECAMQEVGISNQGIQWKEMQWPNKSFTEIEYLANERYASESFLKRR